MILSPQQAAASGLVPQPVSVEVGRLVVIASPALAVGSLADVSVYDRAENRTLPVYYHQGRYYVAGRPGFDSCYGH